MKTKVYSMIHNHGEVGDLIHCCNCGAYSFLRCGDDRCPVCGEEGKNEWVDAEKQEFTLEEIEELGYTIEILRMCNK